MVKIVYLLFQNINSELIGNTIQYGKYILKMVIIHIINTINSLISHI